MVTSRHRTFFDRLLQPPAQAIARLGIAPSAITLAGCALSAAICLWFVHSRAVVPFCLLMLLAGGLDVLDGAVARVSGRTSPFGAYLDALCDRYVEVFAILAAAWVTGYWLLTMAVLTGSLLVSYAKARAAMEVTVSNREWPDLMERGERSLLFLAGLAAGAVVPWRPLGRDLFWWTLMVLAVLIHLTVVQRMLRARGLIRQRAGR